MFPLHPLELFERAIPSGLLLVATIVESSAMSNSGIGIVYPEWSETQSPQRHSQGGGTKMSDVPEGVQGGTGGGSVGVGGVVVVDPKTAVVVASTMRTSTSSVATSSSMHPTMMMNVTQTGMLGSQPDAGHCHEWQPTQHTLFQLANLCYFCAFLVPHNFRLNMLLVRCVLCLGFLMFTLWAGVFICAPDIFAWNLVFTGISLSHVAYLGHQHFPMRLLAEYSELYARLFKPLRVDKHSFGELMRDAQVHVLVEGETYAIEDVTPADQRLSILLTGKLKVTCEDTHLHYIWPNEFLDSPEWEACPTNSGELFQVTITAVEASQYVCWSRSCLQSVFRNRPLLDSIIYNLVGKDITQKLYSLNEHLNPYGGRGSSGSKYGGLSGGWKQDQRFFPRSFSVDVVQTGIKGHVRSNLWRLRSQALPSRKDSESLGHDDGPEVLSATGSSPPILGPDMISTSVASGIRSPRPRVHFPPQQQEQQQPRRKVTFQVLASTMEWITGSFHRVHHSCEDERRSATYERLPLWNLLPGSPSPCTSPSACTSPLGHCNKTVGDYGGG